MRVILQRVKSSQVSVSGQIVGKIDRGVELAGGDCKYRYDRRT